MSHFCLLSDGVGWYRDGARFTCLGVRRYQHVSPIYRIGYGQRVCMVIWEWTCLTPPIKQDHKNDLNGKNLKAFTSSAVGLKVIASGGKVRSSFPSTTTTLSPTSDGSGAASGADSACWGKWLFERTSYILNKVTLSVVRDIRVLHQ